MISTFKKQLVRRLAVGATAFSALLRSLMPVLFIALAWMGPASIAHAQNKVLPNRQADEAQEDMHATGEATADYENIDSDGTAHADADDASGNEIRNRQERHIVGHRLAAELEDTSHDDMLVVKIALHTPAGIYAEPTPEHGIIDVEDGEIIQAAINGTQLALAEESNRSLFVRTARPNARREAARENIIKDALELINKHGLNIPMSAVERHVDTGASMTLTIRKSALKELIASKKHLIAAIDFPTENTDFIESAMQATGVASVYSYQRYPGAGIGMYMTEGGCPEPGSISRYTYMGGYYPTAHSRNVAGIFQAVSPMAFVYCRAGGALPADDELNQRAAGTPPIHIVLQSSGYTIPTRGYEIADRDLDEFVYRTMVLAISAAGNEGLGVTNGLKYVASPGKALNAVTVGSYDHRSGQIAPSSSYANPITQNEKPELSAPGVGISAGGITASGTSQAAPHVAGIAANYMSELSIVQYRPELAKAQLIATATNQVSGGLDRVGVGGVWYPQGLTNYTAMWWAGTNAYFNAYATNGALHGEFTITRIPLTKARVVVAWLNRGVWTYAYQALPQHALGMDFDITVLDPDGMVVGTSASRYNSYEMVEFMPKKTGKYSLRITRFANRDTESDLYLGAWINKGLKIPELCDMTPLGCGDVVIPCIPGLTCR